MMNKRKKQIKLSKFISSWITPFLSFSIFIVISFNSNNFWNERIILSSGK